AVHDATHDRAAEILDAGMRLAPLGHSVLEVALDLLGHLLEERRRSPAAAGTRGDLRQERPQAERLEDLLADLDLALAGRARLGRQGDADRVADPLVEEDREARGRRDDALVPHPGLREPEMERVVGARGKQAIDIDE